MDNLDFALIPKETKKKILKNIELIIWDDVETQLNRKASNLAVSNFEFNSENEKIKTFLYDFAKQNNLIEQLWTLFYRNSRYGRTIIGFDRTKSGDYRMWMSMPQFSSRVAKVNQREKIAIIYTRPVKDDKAFILRKIITDKETKTWAQYGMEEVSLAEVSVKIDDKEQIEAVQKHNFKCLPVMEITNKPLDIYQSRSYVSDRDFLQLADSWPVRMIFYAIQNSFSNKYKEGIKNQTRIFGELSPQLIKDLRDGNTDISEIITDFIIKQKKLGKNGEAPDLSVVMGDPKFQSYNDDKKEDKRVWFEGSGYSYADGDSVETATQTIFQSKNDIETTLAKKDHFTNQFLKFLDKLLYAEGLTNEESPAERDYSFELKTNLHVSEREKVELLNMKEDAGIISRVEKIAEGRNISTDEAETIKTELEKDFSERMEREMEFMEGVDKDMEGNSEDKPDKDPEANKQSPTA